MLNTRKKRLAVGFALTAVLGTQLSMGSAQADPKQLSALVGVGSDTTQDVSNAFAGFSDGIYYTPIRSSTASLARQVISFDATPPAGAGDNCIITRVSAPGFQRPNGSGNGRAALSRALDGNRWGSADCGGLVDVNGLIDYARSSSSAGPIVVNGPLTQIPFARDAMSFAYKRNGGLGGAITSLTAAEITSLYNTGTLVKNNGTENVTIIPCGIQQGSGTYSFWLGRTGGVSNDNLNTVTCNNLGGTGRLQENDPVGLAAKAALAPAGTQVIIGFSAANFIAKSNLVATPNPVTSGVNLGFIDGVAPFTGTGTSLAANAPFYATSFGRFIFNVLPTGILVGAGNIDIKTMFVGTSSAVCQATTTIQTFGFLPLTGTGVNACGDTTQLRGFEPGNSNV